MRIWPSREKFLIWDTTIPNMRHFILLKKKAVTWFSIESRHAHSTSGMCFITECATFSHSEARSKGLILGQSHYLILGNSSIPRNRRLRNGPTWKILELRYLISRGSVLWIYSHDLKSRHQRAPSLNANPWTRKINSGSILSFIWAIRMHCALPVEWNRSPSVCLFLWWISDRNHNVRVWLRIARIGKELSVSY